MREEYLSEPFVETINFIIQSMETDAQVNLGVCVQIFPTIKFLSLKFFEKNSQCLQRL